MDGELSRRGSERVAPPTKRISDRTRDAIEEAAAAGFFSNLPGSGQPLDFSFENNPYIPEGMRSAYRMLRNAGYALPWIEDRKEIDKQRNGLESRLETHLKWVDVSRKSIPKMPAYLRPSRWSRLRATHDEFVRRFERSVESLNVKIDVYNLKVPVVTLQVPRFDGEKTMTRLQAAVPEDRET